MFEKVDRYGIVNSFIDLESNFIYTTLSVIEHSLFGKFVDAWLPRPTWYIIGFYATIVPQMILIIFLIFVFSQVSAIGRRLKGTVVARSTAPNRKFKKGKLA